MGWDGVDEFQGKRPRLADQDLQDLPFRHHVPRGARRFARRARQAQGRAARYLGYRVWYLTLRALWHARREPAALAMIWGYASAALRREPQMRRIAQRAPTFARQAELCDACRYAYSRPWVAARRRECKPRAP